MAQPRKSDGQYWDVAWNPIMGCTPISDGCEHCWAAAVMTRFKTGDPRKIQFHPKRLAQPARWRKPRTIAMCWLGDPFHDDVPESWLYRVFAVIANNPQHRYLILTKRAKRMEEFLRHREPMQQVWLGTSIESGKYLDRLEPLEILKRRFWKTWLSLEPLLGPIQWHGVEHDDPHWAVVGAETGAGARPCKIEWLTDLVTQLRGRGVFVKQIDNRKTPFEQWPAALQVREYPW